MQFFYTASHWFGTRVLVLLSLKDNRSCLLLKDYSSTPLFLSTFSPSHFLSPSLNLLESLPHQLFSSHTEMTPQGNVISVLCVVVRAHTKCLCVVLTCIVFCSFNHIIFRFSYCISVLKTRPKIFYISVYGIIYQYQTHFKMSKYPIFLLRNLWERQICNCMTTVDGIYLALHVAL